MPTPRPLEPTPALAALDAAATLALCTWAVDDEVRLHSVSPAFAALIGGAEAGVTWAALLGDDASFPVEGGTAEYTVVNAEGATAVVILATVPAAEPQQFVSMAVDVTEQARQRRHAEQASDAKSRFLAVMSHELRTPLNVINGQVELLREGVYGAIGERAAQALERVHRAERQLAGIIGEVLTFSRLEMGQVTWDVRPIPLEPALHALVAAVASQCRAKRQTVELQLPAEPITILADEEKLHAALLAIASNASKFTPAEGRIVIDTAFRPEVPDFLYVRITDTGVGVPRDHFESIFLPFAQVDERRARTAEGLGLGLTIARDLVRGMGGEVRVRSRVGEGSTFTAAVRRVPPAG